MEEQQFFTWSKHNGRQAKYGVIINPDGIAITPIDGQLEHASWAEIYQLLQQRHEMKQP